jgi:hypothetical protein
MADLEPSAPNQQLPGEGISMLTVGQLIRQLEHLPPDLPIGALDVNRIAGSQRVTLAVRDVVDLDVAHDPSCGEPLSVWLTCQPSDGHHSVPVVVVQKEGCGCAVPLDPEQDQSVNLDAILCAHHSPDELVARAARR